MCHVKEDSLRNDLLEEFATALQEGYGSICFGEAVVWLVWLGNRDNGRTAPRMVSPKDCGIEQ